MAVILNRVMMMEMCMRGMDSFLTHISDTFSH